MGNKYFKKFFKKTIIWFMLFVFSFSYVIPPAAAQSLSFLPAPGSMVTLSPAFMPALMSGITVHPENGLRFDFIMDKGDAGLSGEALKGEYEKMIKYFLAALTIPEEHLWVNLSPYEKNRIISEDFGTTEMGRDLLAQDYLLKQITSSLIYPESGLGKKFWDKVYKKAYDLFGLSDIPVDTFNKVWIVPDIALIFEKDNTALIIDSRLKVMLEDDYVALQHNSLTDQMKTRDLSLSDADKLSKLSSEVMREVVIPAIEQEVNEGKNFAQLRQIYSAMIMATWYKKALKESLLGKIYADKSKTKGVDLDDKTVNKKIFKQYVDAFKKGVYNYIKEDYDPKTKSIVPKKYFSGGFEYKEIDRALKVVKPETINSNPAQLGKVKHAENRIESGKNDKVPTNLNPFGEATTAYRQSWETAWSQYRQNSDLKRLTDFLNTPEFSRLSLVEKEAIKERINNEFKNYVKTELSAVVYNSNLKNLSAEKQKVIKRVVEYETAKYMKELRAVINNPEFRKAHVSELYHNLAHSVRAAKTMMVLAVTQGLLGKENVTEDSIRFLGQVSLLHDYDSQRTPNSPARVPATLKEIDSNIFGWNNLQILMAKAIIQRSEFPFSNTDTREYYVNRNSSPVEDYKHLLEEIFNIGGKEAVQFTVLNGALFSAYADQASGYMTTFNQALKNAENLAKESGVPVTAIVPSSSVFLGAIGSQNSFNFDQNISDSFDLGIDFGNYTREKIMPLMGQLGKNFETVQAGFTAITQVYNKESNNYEEAVNRGQQAAAKTIQAQKKEAAFSYSQQRRSSQRVPDRGGSSQSVIKKGDQPVIAQQPTTEDKVGGIDLNPANLNMQIKRDGNGVVLPLEMQDVENIQVEGFVPVIIEIVPITTLPILTELFKEGPNVT